MFSLLWISIGILPTIYCGQRPNVLFLMMDDLRPNINILRDDCANGFIEPEMHTPNLDALAEKSLVLKQAYVQLAICAPSRSSMLTGRRPDTTKVYGFNTYWRTHSGNFTTIPQYFKENRYVSIGMGKIFHPRKSSNNNDPISWSRPYFDGVFNFEDGDKTWDAVPDELLFHKPLVDQQIADRAVETLQELALKTEDQENKPFFLAVGFHKPHLPFVFPKSVLEKYPLENIQVPKNMKVPTDMPEIAFAGNHIYRKYPDMRKLNLDRGINGSIPDNLVRDLRRAYYCSVSWSDQQLGRVLNELKRLEFMDNTIIVFLADHGYHLGEHNHWTKFTDFELDLRVPMMIHIPGQTTMMESDQLVELVDLFPTLVEAADLDPLPFCTEDSSSEILCREGKSFYSLLSSPNTAIKKAAFSQIRRGNHMGYSMRTTRYRYTAWVKWIKSEEMPDWRDVLSVELYDHLEDFAENHNVAGKDEYKEVVLTLHRLLYKGYRRAVNEDNLSVDELWEDIPVPLPKQKINSDVEQYEGQDLCQRLQKNKMNM